MGELISIGKILNFHGIKGEVKLGYTKGNEDMLKSLKVVCAQKENQNIELKLHKLYGELPFRRKKFLRKREQ